jgi:hypothetical protein
MLSTARARRVKRLQWVRAFAAVIDAFRTKWGDYLASPENARDCCLQVSNEFIERLQEAGIAAEPISGFRISRNVVLAGHVAVLVDRKVWDWTARQFDPAAAVPLVQSRSQWRETWKDLS